MSSQAQVVEIRRLFVISLWRFTVPNNAKNSVFFAIIELRGMEVKK